MLPPTFYREYLAALMTFPSPLLLRLIFLLPPYFLIARGMHVPYSPLPYLDIGILFLYGKKKQNKTKKYGLFFNVSSSDWLCHLGIWKNHL